MTAWFEVSKEGLAKLLARKSFSHVLYELVQNAWDTNATFVKVQIEPVAGKPLVDIRVEDDDPDGFHDLSHAFTLFAESAKKADATKRGRFNLGEKLVLALCQRAEVISTKGSIIFTSEGRTSSKRKLERGSTFLGQLRMTREQMQEVIDAAALLLPPIPTTVNGVIVAKTEPLKTFEVTLPTEIADGEGFLRKSARKTEVRVYARQPGAPSYIYEMGIPVVETDDPWTVEVMQKVPLNADRDNVTPAYLRELRVSVVNAMQTEITKEIAASPAVQEALSDTRIQASAVESILTSQYGEKRTVFDPSDKEANANAFANGYNVITGGAFTKDQWANIRRAEAAQPSGKVFPTPKPYSDDPDAREAREIPREKWSDGMVQIEEYATSLALKLLGKDIRVVMEAEPRASYAANYGHACLTFNVGRLGRQWFENGITREVNDLLLHEFGHEYASNHLDSKYHEALTKLGAKLAQCVFDDPEFFRDHGMMHRI